MRFPDPVVQKPNGGGGKTVFRSLHDQFQDVRNPNDKRRLALAEIDRAPFGWYHVRACVVAGIGFFTDSYDVRSSPPQTPSYLMSSADIRDKLNYWNVGSCLLAKSSRQRHYALFG